ncbi:AAA domain-containing protein [Emticicia sp. ODNR4P]|nr:AAA domain-containing protein [Emticicia sp. ODNR4P]
MLDVTLESIRGLLFEQGYITDHSIEMALFLSLKLQKPLLIEGPAGVGKTEIAKVMTQILETELIRLQCYEGLDASQALYEWNYQRQLLHLKASEESGISVEEKEKGLFDEKFLLKRPLLKAIQSPQKCVLLIDEIDRADEEFESFLLEVLSDWQITIPELGTIQASSIPQVIVTGNRVRELSEALRRRCLYLWIDYPDFEKELMIVRHRLPNIDAKLAEQICRFMQVLRAQKLEKTPGIAETLDWATALATLHFSALDKNIIESTLGVILKDWKDIRAIQLSLSELLDKTGVQSKVDSF